MIIHLRNLRAQTLLGVYDFERISLREVLINLAITIDASRAIVSENVADTLDYAVLEQQIIASLAKQQFQLLEALATHVAGIVMDHPLALEVRVTIDKPGAVKAAESVAVEYYKRK